MRISVNLASRPFIELRPLYAKLRLAMVVLTLLSFALGYGLHTVSRQVRVAKAQMDDLRAKTANFERERSSNESRMRQPQNSAVLERSRFLNELFAKKSFSWTAVMMDLETVLPAGVQVTSIDPVISKEGDVSIRLRVSGDRDRAVQLVRNLETSKRFLAPRLAAETVQATEGANSAAVKNVSLGGAVVPGAVEFDILSGYNPLTVPRKAGGNKEPGTAGETPARTKPRKAPQANRSPSSAGRANNGVVLKPYVKPAGTPGSAKGGVR